MSEDEAKKKAMELALQSFAEAILVQARSKGITPNLEIPFLNWIGNECYEGREPDDFLLLIQKAPLLAKRFLETKEKNK